jgi:hypothetical protein
MILLTRYAAALPIRIFYSGISLTKLGCFNRAWSIGRVLANDDTMSGQTGELLGHP